MDEREIKRLGRWDIMIVWRGIVMGLEWVVNFKFNFILCGLMDEFKYGMLIYIEVEEGFFSFYILVKEDFRFNKVSV